MKTELAVIGAGPAGLCAAIEAAKNGVEVTVIDENHRPGGQLFKQIHRFFGSEEHLAGIRGMEIGNMLIDEAREHGVKIMLDTVAWGLFPGLKIGIADGQSASVIKADRLIIATGAIENAVAFPGWTLPNIMGAGAAQTMINVNRVMPGKKALILGSGNVGLIVAYQLVQAGIEVAAIVEGLSHVGGYMVHAAKVARMGIKILLNHTIKRASGSEYVEKVEVAQVDMDFKIIKGSEEIIEADLVCIAAGLRPLSELCWMAGAGFEFMPELGGFVPLHDINMQTSIPDIYIAGDIAGIEEASTSMEEGRVAGIAVSRDLGKISDREAGDLLNNVQERLRALRIGPYGEFRQKAKEEIIKRFYAY